MESFDVKNALKFYHTYKRLVKVTESKIEVLNAKKYKVGGSIAKKPENPMDRETIIINNLGKSECLEQRLEDCIYHIHLAEGFIMWLSEKDGKMVDDRYIKCKSWAWIEMNHYITPQGARKKIISLIDDFIESIESVSIATTIR
jgi:hypothetical protein